MSQAVDIYLVYKFIRALSTPFDETDAYKLGLIDEKGKKLRSARTQEEKKAMTYFDRLIFNLKRLLARAGLESRLATFATALLLLREGVDKMSDDEKLNLINENMDYLAENSQKNFRDLSEEIANVTGPAVAGTDGDVTWVKRPYRVGQKGERKRQGRYINGVAYLKKIAREKAKKES